MANHETVTDVVTHHIAAVEEANKVRLAAHLLLDDAHETGAAWTEYHQRLAEASDWEPLERRQGDSNG